MTNVQEALKNTLVMLDALTVEFGITGLEPLIADCKSALAEIEASEKCEPVAYDKNKIRSEVMCKAPTPFYVGDAIDLTMQAMERFIASPQPIEWVSLNYPEILECLPEGAKRVPEGWLEFYQAIEAKLKQLNTKG